MSDGQGCMCMAICASECCCDDVDWTPQELIDLRAERDEAVVALQKLAEGQPFDAVVIADTVKRRTKIIEAERDALQATIRKMAMDSLSVEGQWSDKVDDLEEERDALAATMQKIRDGIRFCIDYKAIPSSELLRIGYESEEILRKRDAKVLRDAAEFFKRNSWFDVPKKLMWMADELEQGK